MEDKTREALERELDAVRHLLDSRGKQIKRLQDDVAGQSEINRLLAGFLPLLALAAAHDGAADEAVRVAGNADALSVSIEKSALAEVLGKWELRTVHTEGVYRLTFARAACGSSEG